MLRIALLLAALLCLASCGYNLDYLDRPAETETDDPSVITIDYRPHCDGYCLETAPATYSGPSLFWFGVPELTPECPDETPYQGIEGFVDSPRPWFARECRVTLSDLCAGEGKTCVPVPDEGYEACIHHANDVGCTTDYTERRTLYDAKSDVDATLCCKSMPLQ